ncbi:MAG: nucleotidyltransferase [Clostridia bacterium]|nr:nucleotidyltransferase [Clostridia bacterium]
MKTAAIICEYNPFHKGHAYQIARTKEMYGAEFVVAIMSGNYVQRGDVAIFSKEFRAKAAIACGIDLVIELPTVFAMQSAEFFARKSVEIANATGIVDILSFGAECNNIESIAEIAKLLCTEPTEFSHLLKSALDTGLAYPAARASAIETVMGKKAAEIISSPNNILGVEYCKALCSSKSTITPVCVKRIGADHDSLDAEKGFSSATNIRRLLLSEDRENALSFLPEKCMELFRNADLHSTKEMEKSVIAELIKMPAEILSDIPDVGEGMENRIKSAALQATTLNELADIIKTKRYTHSRIRRILLSAYLGITKAHRETAVPYIKILDHNEKGCELIAKMKKTATLPVVRNTSQINKLKNPEIKTFWERERMFDKLYEMFK